MNKHESAAPVGREEFEILLARIEDLEDSLEVREAAARGVTAEALPLDMVERLLGGESPIRLYRERRGLTQSAVAKAAGIGKAFLSQLENGHKNASVEVLARIARVLGVSMDALI